MDNIFVGTFWAFLPAIVAIVLALITKQVYLSLFTGIFVGAMFISYGNPLEAIMNMFEIMGGQLGDNGGILIFLVVLGIFAVLMVKSGGSKAYGEWATGKIKSRTGAQLATVALGALIFVDDYFNCLTVGSAMRPVTDKFKISHAKLAYLIDATAAPVCIIAPISSWAAAVTGFIGDDAEGLLDFIKTIPLNLYAVLTIAMMIVLAILGIDFFKMKKNEEAAENGDLFAGETDLPMEDIAVGDIKNGKVSSMIFPIVTLIVCCIGSMYYNGFRDGGAFDVPGFIDAFANCDAGSSLATGSVIALVITIAYYLIAKVMTLKESLACITEGFKSMVPAILILAFAWTLCYIMGAKNQDGSLMARTFIQNAFGYDEATDTINISFATGFIPSIFFLLACFISFSTGTSWGTFGTLIPIAICLLGGSSGDNSMLYLAMSACLAGAVYGDHVSPISDTTIMASSGAQCNHLDHVKTQLPYASVVAVICFISYLVSGLICQLDIGYGFTVLVTLGTGIVLFVITILVLNILQKKGTFDKKAPTEEPFTEVQ